MVKNTLRRFSTSISGGGASVRFVGPRYGYPYSDPIVLRQMIPGLLMIQVTMLQSTLFASLISVDEIFRVAQRINAVVYRPIEVYTALGLVLSRDLPAPEWSGFLSPTPLHARFVGDLTRRLYCWLRRAYEGGLDLRSRSTVSIAAWKPRPSPRSSVRAEAGRARCFDSFL